MQFSFMFQSKIIGASSALTNSLVKINIAKINKLE